MVSVLLLLVPIAFASGLSPFPAMQASHFCAAIRRGFCASGRVLRVSKKCSYTFHEAPLMSWMDQSSHYGGF